MNQPAIVKAFDGLSDPRRRAGMRHSQTLCLALFTLAVAAGCQGFLAIGDWLNGYRNDLIDILQPDKERLPSYSTIRRVLLQINYQQYSDCLAKFFGVQPRAGETLAVDGKVLRGSYQLEDDNPYSAPHAAIMLVSAYIVERGLILAPYEVDQKTNEIKALPELIKQLALKGVVFAFDAINTQRKTCELIVNSDNHYIGALKGNQSGLLALVEKHFTPEDTYQEINKGHGRIERRTVSLCRSVENVRLWPGLQTLIRVESERTLKKGTSEEFSYETRYYVSSLYETAQDFSRRIRGYWGVENKVHYVRDVTQGEDRSRIRTHSLVPTWAIARNFALNLYRSHGFENMAQAQRVCKYGLGTLKKLFKFPSPWESSHST